jgi:hypothetical protein
VQGRRAAIPRYCEQILVIEAEQRAAQRGRQRQIVLRQQQGVGQHHQIHDRDMLGEHEAVGAGDIDLLVFQRTDNRFEQFAALAHQHENIAIAQGAATGADGLAALHQSSHRSCNPARQPHARAGLAGLVERGIPAVDIRAFFRLDRFPDLDQARRCVR